MLRLYVSGYLGVRWAVALVQAGRQPSRKLCAGREQLPEGIIHGRFLFLSSVFATWPLVRLLASFSTPAPR